MTTNTGSNINQRASRSAGFYKSLLIILILVWTAGRGQESWGTDCEGGGGSQGEIIILIITHLLATIMEGQTQLLLVRNIALLPFILQSTNSSVIIKLNFEGHEVSILLLFNVVACWFLIKTDATIPTLLHCPDIVLALLVKLSVTFALPHTVNTNNQNDFIPHIFLHPSDPFRPSPNDYDDCLKNFIPFIAVITLEYLSWDLNCQPAIRERQF